ncbi:MAG: putative histidine kinase [Acidobacteria bacterium]|nr:putative histidine kinase [Acidobacteriota bacterium]
MKINAHRIDSSSDGFTEIARIHQAVATAAPGEVPVDCSNLEWLDANMCAALGAALAAEGRRVRLQYPRPQIETILSKNGFIRDASVMDSQGTTIRYQQFDTLGSAEFETYVFENFRGKGLPLMSEALQRRFRTSIFELFENAVAHSETKLGIFACGQYYPKRQQLHFSVADRGIGIPATVRRFLEENLDAREAIDWAMTETHTTRRVADGVPGGWD